MYETGMSIIEEYNHIVQCLSSFENVEKLSAWILIPGDHARFCYMPTVEWLVAVGFNIYAISRKFKDGAPCSNISYLDCRTHTWLEAPSMRIANTDSEFDGDLYLPESYQNPGSLNCIEVFNTNTQTWNPVQSEKRILKPEIMEGKTLSNFSLDSIKDGGVAYNLKEKTCELVGWDSNSGRDCFCVIRKICYSYNSSRGRLYWSSTKSSVVLRKLEGLEGLPKFGRYSNVKLVGYGGKLMVLWDKYVPSSMYKKKMIWCAEISLEKRNDGEEIWGNVDWVDAVLKVPKSYKFTYAIAANL